MTAPATTPAATAPASLGHAILQTVVYADIFDCPLTAGEIARYLIGCRASLEAVRRAIADDPLVAAHLAEEDRCYFLAHRREIVRRRRERAAAAAMMWPRAIRYGRLIARLPFVRMVAVTGALAVDNTDRKSDLDYFVVTEPGRLWSARACTIALVRLAAPTGDVICPNYFLASDCLAFDDRNLFTAHEVTQMVVVSGFDVYAELRRVNSWTADFLPNAAGPPNSVVLTEVPGTRLQHAAERMGRTGLGARLERWEMQRKVRRFTAAGAGEPEAVFSADMCKGHLDGHGRRILARFADRLAELRLDEVMPPGAQEP